jgi:hypothetical protein
MTDLVTNQVQINPFENFCFGLRSKETQRQYPKILNIFLDFILTDNNYPYQNKEGVNNSLEEKCLVLVLEAYFCLEVFLLLLLYNRSRCTFFWIMLTIFHNLYLGIQIKLFIYRKPN